MVGLRSGALASTDDQPTQTRCFYSYVLQFIFYSSPLKAIGMKFCIELSHIQDYISLLKFYITLVFNLKINSF